jgi:Rieske Fe-S protein
MNALPSPTRRTVLSLGGVTILGAGAVMLAACSPAGAESDGDGSDPQQGGSGSPLASGTTVLALADLPVGGTASATIDGQQLLLSQPTAGTVHCFSAICTHQGCIVAAAAKDFECPCHGSVFSETGAVMNGPAVVPLNKVPVKVSDGNVVTA